MGAKQQVVHSPTSLAGMLMAQQDYTPPPKASNRSPAQLAHLKDNHRLHFERGLAKYKGLLQGRGWLQTKKVEWLVGANATGANQFLRKLRGLGYVESRNAGGTERYFKNRGNDWRWLDTRIEVAK